MHNELEARKAGKEGQQVLKFHVLVVLSKGPGVEPDACLVAELAGARLVVTVLLEIFLGCVWRKLGTLMKGAIPGFATRIAKDPWVCLNRH